MTTMTQRRLKEAIQTALDSGIWVRVPEAHGYVIRYTERDLPTPDWARNPGIHGRFALWAGETYDRHVFISIIGGKSWSLILSVSRAPWARGSDSRITMKRAFDVLADPKAVLS